MQPAWRGGSIRVIPFTRETCFNFMYSYSQVPKEAQELPLPPIEPRADLRHRLEVQLALLLGIEHSAPFGMGITHQDSARGRLADELRELACL